MGGSGRQLGLKEESAGIMLVVDPWHWLTKEGDFVREDRRLYLRMLRIARFIEYGGPLSKLETRETLVECKRRPHGKPCPGLIWVVKGEDDSILAHCVVCNIDEASVHNWQETNWAGGMMEPLPVQRGVSAPRRAARRRGRIAGKGAAEAGMPTASPSTPLTDDE